MRLLASLAVLLLSINCFAFTGFWKYGAVITNPTTSTVFATTGALPSTGSSATPPSANYVVGAMTYCSVNETYEIQVLNASSVVTATVPIPCSSTSTNMVQPGGGNISFPIQDGWTVQVIPAVGFTGFGSAQLFYAIEGVN